MALVFGKFQMCSLLFITVSYARFPQNSERKLRDFLFHQDYYTPKQRPVLNPNQTVHVRIQMQLYAMLDLNERDEVLTTASWMTLIWKDERMVWDPSEYEGLDNIVVQPDEIWTPKVFISNSLTQAAIGLISPDRSSAIVGSDGTVSLGTPLVQSTQCALNARYFPFDTQSCPISFIPVNQYFRHMYLTAEQPDEPSYVDSVEWNLLNTTITNYIIPYGSIHYGTTDWYSGTYVCVNLQRDPQYYITTIIVPSTLICLMALVTFLAPPNSGERISLGVSMVLGLTVFQLLLTNTLPTASKNPPILSSYLTVNFILACLAVPFSLLNINIAYSQRVELLKYQWMRTLLLEGLPCILCVSTSNKTVRSERVEANARKDDRSHLKTSEGNADGTVRTNSVRQNSVAPIASATYEDQSEEQAKHETRIVAVVMDRLVLIGFLLVFGVFCVRTAVKFTANPGVNFEECF